MVIQSLSVYARLPPPELFSWPFDHAPVQFPPRPPHDSTWLQRFTFPPSLFHTLIDIKAPATISAVYLISVIYLNGVNDSRKNRPWSFAKTSVFKYSVVLHNSFLAFVSAWAFYGLCHSLRKCWPSTTEPNFLVNVAHTLCRLTALDISQSLDYHVGRNESVQPSIPPHLGCLYSNGFVYFAWILYILKFYQVADTLITLAKGKRSSALQAYHHSGVILCGWAGARYASPPFLVGVFFNSAIHTLVYLYFAWSSAGFKVFGCIKQILTAFEIAQFVIGGSLIWGYFFIEYDTLIYHPEGLVGRLSSTISKSKDALYSMPTVPRAPGENGASPHLQHPQGYFQVQKSSCLKSSGEALAVWLTTLYLIPLTYLFVGLFRHSYMKRAQCHKK